MDKSQLWEELHDLFDTDDGSLPEIELTNLNSSQIGNIFLFLLSLGKEIQPNNATFWDNKLDQERSITSVGNAATLVTEYRASHFHIVVIGISLNGMTIPDLGVFVFQKNISLDYRMGSRWEPAQLSALFKLLSQIKKIAPEMNITLQEGEPEENQKRFQKALNQYFLENSA
jgi:hypothetical protein